MTGRANWPDDDRPRWHVAGVDPERPAEITLPLPVGQCARCATDDYAAHVWSEVDREVFGRVTVRRAECVCDLCGRCDARIVVVDVASGIVPGEISESENNDGWNL